MKSKLPVCFFISSALRENDDFVGTEAKRGEDDDVGSERMSKLHAHVTQSAETDHANFLAVANPHYAAQVGGYGTNR
jgi:hypothetical protein